VPDVSQLIDRPRLVAADLEDGEWNVVIDRIEFQSLGKQMEAEGKTVACVYFRGWTKFLPLSAKTNLEQIAAVTGERNTDNWPGHALTLFVAPSVGPKGEDGIRIKNRQPDSSQADSWPIPAACQPLD